MVLWIHYLFTIYTLLIATRIIASWFPSTRGQPWLIYIASLTDPFLNIFRRIIPPIGGVLDLSPIIAFLALQFLEQMIYKLLL